MANGGEAGELYKRSEVKTFPPPTGRLITRYSHAEPTQGQPVTGISQDRDCVVFTG